MGACSRTAFEMRSFLICEESVLHAWASLLVFLAGLYGLLSLLVRLSATYTNYAQERSSSNNRRHR